MHPNVDRLRAGYEAFGRGDLDSVQADWSEDIVWHVTGSTPIAGDRRGSEEIKRFLGEFIGLTNGTFQLEPLRYFADDDWGVVICRQQATLADQQLDGLTVHLHRLVDGKTVESWFLDEHALEDEAVMRVAFGLNTVPA